MKDVADGVKSVVVAIGPGENDDSKFHAVTAPCRIAGTPILAHTSLIQIERPAGLEGGGADASEAGLGKACTALSRPSTFTRLELEGTMYFVFWARVLFRTSRRRMVSARSLKYVSAAVETSLMASASALARVMRAWASPSASSTAARFSRSAFIWRDMASVMSRGGSIFCTSTRVALTPQLLVASSRT